MSQCTTSSQLPKLLSPIPTRYPAAAHSTYLPITHISPLLAATCLRCHAYSQHAGAIHFEITVWGENWRMHSWKERPHICCPDWVHQEVRAQGALSQHTHMGRTQNGADTFCKNEAQTWQGNTQRSNGAALRQAGDKFSTVCPEHLPMLRGCTGRQEHTPPFFKGIGHS